MRYRLATTRSSSVLIIAATLAAFSFNFVVLSVVVVEAFNVNPFGTTTTRRRRTVPSIGIRKNGPTRDTMIKQQRFIVQSFSNTQRAARLYDTKLLYQRGTTRRCIKSIPPSKQQQQHYFMEELLQGKNEIIVQATTKSFETEETKDMDMENKDDVLDTQKFELEMAYRMAELEYLFHNTHHHHHHLVEEEEEYSLENSKLQLTANTSPSTDMPATTTNNSNNNDATPNLEETSLLTNNNANNANNAKHQHQTKNKTFPFLDEVIFARILVLLSAALYGTNFTMVKLLDETVPVGIGTTLRFGIASLATLPWLLAPPTTTSEKEVLQQESKHDDDDSLQKGQEEEISKAFRAAISGFEVGMWVSVGYVAQAVGLQTTDASKSAFICSLAVVVVPILDYFFSNKNLSSRKTIGAAMAIAGVGFLEFGGGGGGTKSEQLSFLSSGDVLSLVQPLAFGVGFWRMESAMHKYPTEASRMTASQILAVFVASAAYCILSAISGGGGVDDTAASLPTMSQLTTWLSDPIILGELFWTGTITTAFTVYMETLALKTLSAAETTLLFSTEPLWGAAFAAVVVGERFGFGGAVGALLILGGCIFSNLSFANDNVTEGLTSVATGANSEVIYKQEGVEIGELAADVSASSLNDVLTVVDGGGSIIDSTVHTAIGVSTQMAP